MAAKDASSAKFEPTDYDFTADDCKKIPGPIRAVLTKALQFAKADAPVFIRGETGVGKELVARFIHRCGSRQNGPWIAENVTAIPSTLLESELFGHVKGAFTGATQDHDGIFVRASGGTLFLDEIGDLSADQQTKLLRVLQEGKVRRVGGTEVTPVNVRIVTATHQPIERLERDGKFRSDLKYRIGVLELHVPPLRERREELPDICRRMTLRKDAQFRVLDDEAVKFLQGTQYPWPGNIRELENVLRRANALATSKELTKSDVEAALADAIRFSDSAPAAGEIARPVASNSALPIALPPEDLLAKLLEMEDLEMASAHALWALLEDRESNSPGGEPALAGAAQSCGIGVKKESPFFKVLVYAAVRLGWKKIDDKSISVTQAARELGCPSVSKSASDRPDFQAKVIDLLGARSRRQT